MARDVTAAKARAEALFSKPAIQSSSGRTAVEIAERELRERTAKLKEARLAKETAERPRC